MGEYSKGEIKLLVAPEIDSSNHYHAYIITQKDSEVEKFKDLKNKSFAFTDPLSNTGRFYPLKKIVQLHENESDFFRKTVYTYGHDISIQMVNRGIIDGASVHGLIFEYLSNILDEIKQSDPSISYIFLLNNTNGLVAQTYNIKLPDKLLYANSLNSDEYSIKAIKTKNFKYPVVRDIAYPILNGEVGTVRLGIVEEHIQQEIYYAT